MHHFFNSTSTRSNSTQIAHDSSPTLLSSKQVLNPGFIQTSLSYFDFFGYSKPKLKQIDLIRSLGLYFDFFEYRKPKLILIDLKNLNYKITWIIFDFFGSSKPKLKQINLIRSFGLNFDFF